MKTRLQVEFRKIDHDESTQHVRVFPTGSHVFDRVMFILQFTQFSSFAAIFVSYTVLLVSSASVAKVTTVFHHHGDRIKSNVIYRPFCGGQILGIRSLRQIIDGIFKMALKFRLSHALLENAF